MQPQQRYVTLPPHGQHQVVNMRQSRGPQALEDHFECRPNVLAVDNRSRQPGQEPVHLFAVYDGHTTDAVSKHCAAKLHLHLRGHMQQQLEAGASLDEAAHAGLKAAFADTDTELKRMGVAAASGSTATVALVTPSSILLAFCGDSRAVVTGAAGDTATQDHKATREDELDRVEAAGGKLLNAGGELRVMGMLACTRSIGDHDLQEFGVTAEPEVIQISRSEQDHYLIIASDGLWDKFSNQEAVHYSRELYKREASLPPNPSSKTCLPCRAAHKAAYAMASKARKGRQSRDDITVLVVNLQHPCSCSRSVGAHNMSTSSIDPKEDSTLAVPHPRPQPQAAAVAAGGAAVGGQREESALAAGAAGAGSAGRRGQDDIPLAAAARQQSIDVATTTSSTSTSTSCFAAAASGPFAAAAGPFAAAAGPFAAGAGPFAAGAGPFAAASGPFAAASGAFAAAAGPFAAAAGPFAAAAADKDVQAGSDQVAATGCLHKPTPQQYQQAGGSTGSQDIQPTQQQQQQQQEEEGLMADVARAYSLGMLSKPAKKSSPTVAGKHAASSPFAAAARAGVDAGSGGGSSHTGSSSSGMYSPFADYRPSSSAASTTGSSSAAASSNRCKGKMLKAPSSSALGSWGTSSSTPARTASCGGVLAAGGAASSSGGSSRQPAFTPYHMQTVMAVLEAALQVAIQGVGGEEGGSVAGGGPAVGSITLHAQRMSSSSSSTCGAELLQEAGM